MKNKKSAVAVLLAFSFFIFSRDLAARERRGAEIVIQKQAGSKIRGELIAVKPNSLLLLDSISGVDLSVDIGDIVFVKVIKKSRAGKGALFGLLAGTGAGVVSATTIQGGQEGDPWGKFWSDLFRASAIVLFIVAGTLIGLAVGAALGLDQTIKFEGKSPQEIKGALAKLRTQARIPDFQ